MHLLFTMNNSKAGERSRKFTGAEKHMIHVRANLAHTFIVSGLLRLLRRTVQQDVISSHWVGAREGQQ